MSKQSATTTVDDKTGHRDRLRQRFLAGGPDALPDYELLELILFAAIPRRDVKPLAKSLLNQFGSLRAIVNAPHQLLAEQPGLGPNAVTMLKALQATALRMLQRDVMQKPILSSWTAVLDYLHAAMADLRDEQFRLLFVDRKNRLIADEVQQTGSVDHTPVYPRKVIERALSLGATALILVHNHPSGDPEPSRDDIELTRQLVAAAKPLGVVIHDHIIISRSGHTSLKSLGHI